MSDAEDVFDTVVDVLTSEGVHGRDARRLAAALLDRPMTGLVVGLDIPSGPVGGSPEPARSVADELVGEMVELGEAHLLSEAVKHTARPSEPATADEIGGDPCGDLLPGDESLPLAGNAEPEPEQ